MPDDFRHRRPARIVAGIAVLVCVVVFVAYFPAAKNRGTWKAWGPCIVAAVVGVVALKVAVTGLQFLPDNVSY